MQDFGNFLAQYWPLIVATIMTIVSTIFALIRKQPKEVVNKWTELLGQLSMSIPSLVIQAEKQCSDADHRRVFVLSSAIEIAKKLNKAELTDLQQAQVLQLARVQMEDILTAPTKKGGLGREETK